MRITLPRLLLISAGLHLALIVGLILHVRAQHGRASLIAGPISQTSLIFTLHSEPASDRLVASGAFRPDPNPNGTSAAPVAPSVADRGVASSPPPSLALKDSSRAHLRGPSDSALAPASAPPVNSGEGVVFVLDVSGSMYEPYHGTTRLALARQVLIQRVMALKNGAPFALVVYGERAQRSGPLVRANAATREGAARFLENDYDLGGGTNLPSGLSLAADLNMGAIVLATDGDLNMTERELFPQVRQILGPAGESPALTVIAIAPRDGTDDRQILEDLAARQGGNYLVGRLNGAPDLLTATKAPADP